MTFGISAFATGGEDHGAAKQCDGRALGSQSNPHDCQRQAARESAFGAEHPPQSGNGEKPAKKQGCAGSGLTTALKG